MGLIISLTLMNTPRNVEMSEAFRVWLVDFFNRIGIDGAWWNSSAGIRKLGHVIEYGLLGIASGIAFDSHRNGVLRDALRSTLKPLGLCLGISVLDQSVKILVPIRHFDVSDIPFDIIGAVLGIGIVSLIRVLKKRG